MNRQRSLVEAMELTKLSEVTQLTVPEVVHALALVLSVSVEADRHS